MTDGDGAVSGTESQQLEVHYAACNDCDWYELTGEDEHYADELAYEHQQVHSHESYHESWGVEL